MNNTTTIGETNWRNSRFVFGIKDNDRLGHIYVLGKTGTGKSTLLERMAISDIERGNGCCIIDPHGDIAEHILHYVPKERIDDVVYFNATDFAFPIGFNPLHNVSPNEYSLVTSNLISTFKKVWSDSWGPRLEHIFRFALLALLHYPSATLLDVQLLLIDPLFRRKVLNHVHDDSMLNFWNNEFGKYAPQLKSEAIAPILNKVGVLLSSLPLRNIFGQHRSTFGMQDILDHKKILICNLSKGIIGEDAAAVLGSIILTAIQSGAAYRATQATHTRVPFYLYVDEMHSFVTLSFAGMLAESRKYGLSLFLSHQYIDQLHDNIRAAIFGNVGTLICFRIGASDARYIAQEFAPVFTEEDLVNLPKYSMYIKLMIDGATSKPFSADTIQLPPYNTSYKQTILAHSRERYTKKKERVEEEIFARYRHNTEVKQRLFD